MPFSGRISEAMSPPSKAARNALRRCAWRRDQHDAAAVGGCCVVHWLSIPVFAYAGRRWLDCGIEQSARLEQAGRRIDANSGKQSLVCHDRRLSGRSAGLI